MTELSLSALVSLVLAVTSAVVVGRSAPFISTDVSVANGSSSQDDVTLTVANDVILGQSVTSPVVEHETSTPAVLTSSEEPNPPPSSIDHILESVASAPDSRQNVLRKHPITRPPDEPESSTPHPDIPYIPLSSLHIIGLLLNSSNINSSLDPADIPHSVLGVGLTNGSLPIAFLDEESTVTDGDNPDADIADQGNPYVHWDSDSEEQEIELHLKPNPRQESNTETVKPEPSSATSPSVSRSYLILLAGNSTIVKLRQEDFAKYLKLNLAARLSLEYDDVKVNRVVLAPPRLVVNVSVVTPEASAETTLLRQMDEATKSANDDASLHMLAETNATLLELSGEEYHVMRLLPLRSEEVDTASPIPPSTTPSDAHEDIELVIYTVLGGICVAIIFATLLRIAVQRYNNITSVSWFMPKSFYPTWNLPRHERMGGDDVPVSTRQNYASPPTVIYSGSFAARAASSQPGWMDEALLEDTGMNTLKRPFDMDISRTYQSPSKLHIFSCRPGSVVMPMPYHTPTKSHHHTESEEERCLGHDNPNYQT